ncbi:O-antigen polysaccharide polymerase Wzy [Vibrio aestuarianus]|uniref:O-antigen polysaccharide polymerase Wzy n=1 Tax=Vibrio aestuarianus TaxID=28171 RepID=A0A9X4FL85_9VIBR|nr:O-antigen polysaccharide polymerase Wzy [Vibrio aestuarianus]MDE1357271.1 O-antigen polysaccharide polymerase Wzy [Vibrio aestuarianus]
MKLIFQKKHIVFSLWLFSFIYIAIYLVSEFIFHIDMYLLLIFFVVSNLSILFVSMTKRDYLSPNALFIVSVLIFILIRPILSGIGDFEVISIGLKINVLNITKAVVFTMVTVNVIAMTALLSSSRIERYYNFIPKINIFNNYIEVLFFSFAILFSLYFLYMSYLGMLKLASGMDYFKFTVSGAYDHLQYFFISKLCYLISYLFSKRKIGIVMIASCCFFTSIGFIIIGLRGYTVAYLFLFLSIINLRYKLKIFPLIIVAAALLMISSVVLNFRLGYNVTSSYIDMLVSPFHQQGASFEVVFGAVNFRDELITCISFIDYFLKEDFGSCVDKVRGVYFSEGGGFASSYFAEVYYLGILPAIFISIVFGISLSFLSSAYVRLRENIYSDKLSGVIVFLLVPNLVYFARSSAFDFVIKMVQVLILVLLILLFKRLMPKNVPSS